MRLLLVCHRPPLIPADGCSMATRSMIDGLLNEPVDLEVMTAETERHPSVVTPEVAEVARIVAYEAWFADTRVTPMRALRGLAQESYNVQRFDSPAGHQALSRRLGTNRYDAIVLDSLFSAPYIPLVRAMAPGTPVILRAQNVEHHIWQGLAREAGIPRSLYLSHLARCLRHYETRIFSLVDGIAAISSFDEATIGRLAPDVPTALVEIGLAHHYEPAPVPTDAPLCSIASYDWMPNIAGMRWFLDEVWPTLRRAEPSARLDIAGRHVDRFRSEFERPGVRVLGPVESSSGFLTERGVMIAPLRSGSGIKVKLVEGMLLGRPIVTTSEGASGLQTDPDEPMRVRDDPETFANAVVELLRDPSTAATLGAKARQSSSLRFSTSTISEALLDLIDRAGQYLSAETR